MDGPNPCPSLTILYLRRAPNARKRLTPPVGTGSVFSLDDSLGVRTSCRVTLKRVTGVYRSVQFHNKSSVELFSCSPRIPKGKCSMHAAGFSTNNRTIGYDTRRYFNVRSKADMSQLSLPQQKIAVTTIATHFPVNLNFEAR